MKHLQEELSELQSSVIAQSVSLVIIDSIAALARKEGFNERDKEQFFITQVEDIYQWQSQPFVNSNDVYGTCLFMIVGLSAEEAVGAVQLRDPRHQPGN